jgi:hypothetical protein
VVGEHLLDELAQALRAICVQHDGARTVLQMDFVGVASGPWCVLRVATGPRTWMKVGDGPWHDGYLQALIGRGMVESVDRARLGATLRVLPGLLGCGCGTVVIDAVPEAVSRTPPEPYLPLPVLAPDGPLPSLPA